MEQCGFQDGYLEEMHSCLKTSDITSFRAEQSVDLGVFKHFP